MNITKQYTALCMILTVTHVYAHQEHTSPQIIQQIKDTALLAAAGTDDLSLVTQLIKQGANTNFETVDGMNPLRAASLNGNRHVMKILFRRGAKPQSALVAFEYIMRTMAGTHHAERAEKAYTLLSGEYQRFLSHKEHH